MNLHQEVTRLKQKSISVRNRLYRLVYVHVLHYSLTQVTEQLSNTRKHLTETSKTNDELAVKVGMLQEQVNNLL